MLQNKIYQNFLKEILKTFLVILFGLSLIAMTVKAVNFLDLIVDNGYSIKTYFTYTILNFFGIEKIDIICADQMALDYEKSIKEAEKQIENIS